MWQPWRAPLKKNLVLSCRSAVSWQPPSVSTFSLCLSFPTEATLPQAALCQWLSTAELQGPGHFCPMQNFPNSNLCSGGPHWVGQDCEICVVFCVVFHIRPVFLFFFPSEVSDQHHCLKALPKEFCFLSLILLLSSSSKPLAFHLCVFSREDTSRDWNLPSFLHI